MLSAASEFVISISGFGPHVIRNTLPVPRSSYVVTVIFLFIHQITASTVIESVATEFPV